MIKMAQDYALKKQNFGQEFLFKFSVTTVNQMTIIYQHGPSTFD